MIHLALMSGDGKRQTGAVCKAKPRSVTRGRVTTEVAPILTRNAGAVTCPRCKAAALMVAAVGELHQRVGGPAGRLLDDEAINAHVCARLNEGYRHGVLPGPVYRVRVDRDRKGLLEIRYPEWLMLYATGRVEAKDVWRYIPDRAYGPAWAEIRWS